MQYHARALADSGAEVDLVGHVASEMPPEIARDARIRVHALPSPACASRHRLPRPLFLVTALWNLARQTVALLATLERTVGTGDVILVQTPPALPTLGVALLAARRRRARLVIDWHNLAWAMLALRLGSRHPVVRLARAAERALGRRAHAHLCVSRALAAELARWGIRGATVLRDRPAAAFVPVPPDDRRIFLHRLAPRLAVPGLCDGNGGRRPALIVSPTSWTADEDFRMLVDAAVRWDERVRAERDASFPPLAIVVTGDGPLRTEYERRFAALRLERVYLRTLWLAPAEYPRFLGAADLGLCLHRSASGLDLPMKIADLAGAGVPVVALDYGPCLRELLRDGDNALLFRTGDELVECLRRLFRGFPHHTALLDRLRAGLAAEAAERWTDAAAPLLMPCAAR